MCHSINTRYLVCRHTIIKHVSCSDFSRNGHCENGRPKEKRFCIPNLFTSSPPDDETIGTKHLQASCPQCRSQNAGQRESEQRNSVERSLDGFRCLKCIDEQRIPWEYEREANGGLCCQQGIDEWEMMYGRIPQTRKSIAPLDALQRSPSREKRFHHLKRMTSTAFARSQATEAARSYGWQSERSSPDPEPELLKDYINISGNRPMTLPQRTCEPEFPNIVEPAIDWDRWNSCVQTGHGRIPAPRYALMDLPLPVPSPKSARALGRNSSRFARTPISDEADLSENADRDGNPASISAYPERPLPAFPSSNLERSEKPLPSLLKSRRPVPIPVIPPSKPAWLEKPLPSLLKSRRPVSATVTSHPDQLGKPLPSPLKSRRPVGTDPLPVSKPSIVGKILRFLKGVNWKGDKCSPGSVSPRPRRPLPEIPAASPVMPQRPLPEIPAPRSAPPRILLPIIPAPNSALPRRSSREIPAASSALPRRPLPTVPAPISGLAGRPLPVAALRKSGRPVGRDSGHLKRTSISNQEVDFFNTVNWASNTSCPQPTPTSPQTTAFVDNAASRTDVSLTNNPEAASVPNLRGEDQSIDDALNDAFHRWSTISFGSPVSPLSPDAPLNNLQKP